MEQKIYITKYALTRGIIEKEARISDYGGGHLRAFANGDYSSYGIGSEAFYTKEEALKNAEKRRTKKIESLRKQIQKLENIKFDDYGKEKI
jgi:hypothetical protein